MKQVAFHIPNPPALIIHLILLLMIPVFSVPFILPNDKFLQSILISILISFETTNIIILILSLMFWWNVPLRFDKHGIWLKKRGRYVLERWNDISEVDKKASHRTFYGYLNKRYVVKFKDGVSVSFEINRLIHNDILFFCKEKNVIDKFNSAYYG